MKQSQSMMHHCVGLHGIRAFDKILCLSESFVTKISLNKPLLYTRSLTYNDKCSTWKNYIKTDSLIICRKMPKSKVKIRSIEFYLLATIQIVTTTQFSQPVPWHSPHCHRHQEREGHPYHHRPHHQHHRRWTIQASQDGGYEKQMWQAHQD